jgi:glucose-6-phosphate isomerase
MKAQLLWQVFKDRLIYDEPTGFALDVSRISYDAAYLPKMESRVRDALSAMEALEKGAVANPDEKRMVGHYWLRNPSLAPSADISQAITTTVERIKDFAKKVHEGEIVPAPGKRFSHLLVIGIGGSALGPQFVNQALRSAVDPMAISFFDNTDPDGMAQALACLRDLSETLVVVISKSGGTKETRNGQLIAKEAFQRAGLSVSRHFVAVTGDNSELDRTAVAEQWLARFPMWDWVGGRTSQCSAVGLLPMALQGFDIERFLSGAAAMDALTRQSSTPRNPASMLALAWYHCGCGKGMKDMVILPYKDRLELFSRYLQQLVMESLGKRLDLHGDEVHQGIAVYGNKGSTDQHAYVQQLRDGLHNFFVTFIEVLSDSSPKTKVSHSQEGFEPSSVYVEDGVTSGDYLTGFYLGTRTALFEEGRESVTVTIPRVDEFYVGMLIALFERTVGLYASMININAYHQPGVEAGKKAAGAVIVKQREVEHCLRESSQPLSVDEIARSIGAEQEQEVVFKILRHLAENGRVTLSRGDSIFEDRYSV